MAIRDLIPWKREAAPARREDAEQDPFTAFRNQMDRVFDDFWGGRGLAPWGDAAPWSSQWSGFDPKVDVIETEDQVKVEAELPGLDAEDVHVSVTRNVLSIKGEKRQEHEESGENWTRTERSYGSFERAVALPHGADADQVEAEFDKGVLTITFAKTGEARRKIAVKTN